ncbi:MAG: serine/threonine-protein kinase [Myxococcales bacterium]|nr:serine/threonine-protein kinase [Myxococcales bacterium]
MAETLGPYTLEKRIGAGGMADVFLAKGPRGVCVIKRPHPHLCANEDFVRMFLDEAAILASLHHPNIAEIFDLGQVNGAYYLAMEYVPGFDLMTISLEHERQGELMAPELCARIIADVAGALHSAHEAKHPKTGQALSLIHRDVTPHNVLLSTSGVVKLIDFGVARAATATHRTQAGLVKGKYPYMSPEQITDQAIDRRVDVYALGLVLYELLTNTRAIAGNTEVEQIDNARASRIRPIEQLRPNLPMPLRQILASCVHPDRDGRYPTALALKEDLEKFLKFVGQPIGQEDLLRLFRVVAAEVAHLEPGTPPQMSAAEAQHTWGGARTEQEIPSDPAAMGQGDLALGVAPTAPSMRQIAPVLPNNAPDLKQPFSLAPTLESKLAGQAVSPKATDAAGSVPKELQSTGIIGDRKAVKEAIEGEVTLPAPTRGLKNWAVLGGLALIVIIAGALLLGPQASKPVVEVVDAGTAVPLIAVIEDAGAPDLEVDAGDVAVVEAPVDAGSESDPRAAIVRVTADIPMAVTSSGHKYGVTPTTLELAPGRHVIEASNGAFFCSKSDTVELVPGDNVEIKFINARGKLELRAEPLAEFFINGRKVPGPLTSVKDVELCEGAYTIKAAFSGLSKTARARVSAGNVVKVSLGDLSK